MTTQRTIDDLTPEDRKRIVAGWRKSAFPRPIYCEIGAACFGVSRDTVRDVLREAGE